jgi:3-oxoacyl-[acyl-carrier protein] reductase
MDLGIKNHLFIVGGATSGFGKSIAEALLHEGANIIAVARGKEKLHELYGHIPTAEIVTADLTQPSAIIQLQQLVGNRQLHGIVMNAGGPPAKMVLETTISDWDDAYQKILRWKVDMVHAFTPLMIKAGYGRLLLIESSSVKQPIENLVLSNSLRLAVVGMVKTISQEIAATGVTANIMGPGSHNTPAIDRLYHKKVEQTGLTFEEVKKNAIQQIPVKSLGEPVDFAGLALWLLSPQSRYVTGQTMMVDGGMVKGVF